MRAAILCLNFPALAFNVIRAKGNQAGEEWTFTGEATVGNVEFVNVLKTTD